MGLMRIEFGSSVLLNSITCTAFDEELPLFARVSAACSCFFSNGVGIAGSIAVSVLLTLFLIYACSGP
jgi:hypothetical protein